MTITKALCQQILDTLPIGYYAGRKINVTLDEKENTSFYSPMEDSIVISLPIIADRLKNASENINSENAVRSMLYHEVSHAILTPTELRVNDIINIFEDERIETLLRNYYTDVDFRQQLLDIFGGNPPKATNSTMAFYNAVRFGISNAAIQKRINQIIEDFSFMNRTTGESPCYDYWRAIMNLYDLIVKQYKKFPEEFQSKTASGSGTRPNGDIKGSTADENGEGKENNTSEAEGNKNGESDKNNTNKTKGSENNTEDEFLKGRPVYKKNLNPQNIASTLDKKANLNYGQTKELEKFQKAVEVIISNFNKKNNSGYGINAYSGVFNPRAVARQDYRYFDKPITTNGNNKYGSCHLNLIIDCSGSFFPNEKLTNSILAVLSEIERKNKNFSLDVSFVNTKFRTCKTVRERCFVARDGNKVPKDMKQILLRQQKPQTCNYNIILFDGDAMSDEGTNYSTRIEKFKAFDMKQTTLITDKQNEQYIKDFTATKVIYTRHYTDELIKHILNALTVAFN